LNGLKLNKKYRPLWESPSRFFVVTGGRGSSKSFTVNVFLTQLLFEIGHKVLFTRYTLTSASKSIIPEFLEKIDIQNFESAYKINNNEIENTQSGSSILFSGIKTSSGNQTANLKSLQGITTWVLDEAEELTDEETFDKINLSVRQKGVQNRVIIILNPTTKEHWIYRRFFEGKGVGGSFNGTIGDTTYIHTTYLDNISNLDESYIQSLENMKIRRPEKYKNQILGGWRAKAEGVIFNNWTIGEFDNSLISIFGQDYGFKTDPSTLVEVAIDNKKKIIYVKESFYKQGLTTSEIYLLNNRFAGQKLIIADSAEPRLIHEVSKKGSNITGVKKGKDSIITGISIMLDYDIVITPESINLIKEFNNYSWHDKKSQTPIDNYNHGIDSIRYAVYYSFSKVSGNYARPINHKVYKSYDNLFD